MVAQVIVNEPMQCGDCGGYYDPSTTLYKGVCPSCYLKNKAEYDALLQETTWKFRADVSYVVKDEHTLGYIFDAQPGLMGVLSSNKHGHHPHGGPVSIFGAQIRPATVEDFATFRVVVPPDFKSEQVNSAPAMA
jgi:hypothetical protein